MAVNGLTVETVVVVTTVLVANASIIRPDPVASGPLNPGSITKGTVGIFFSGRLLGITAADGSSNLFTIKIVSITFKNVLDNPIIIK